MSFPFLAKLKSNLGKSAMFCERNYISRSAVDVVYFEQRLGAAHVFSMKNANKGRKRRKHEENKVFLGLAPKC